MTPAREPFALYVHFPWCRHVCPYCDFNVYASQSPPADAYMAAVGRELRTHVAASPWEGRRVRSVYLGGGTPSLMPPGLVHAFLDAVRNACGLVADAEVSLEANPGTLTAGGLAGYRAAGVTRLSIGAQSFQPAHLRTLGRDHGPDDVRQAVALARAAGLRISAWT